jgi:GrpB-like predicted nucleotidyltransferase (UPF0157 family)
MNPKQSTHPLVVAYDPGWVNEFRELSAELSTVLGKLANGIHHVGSTAIPGMMAKPVLDIDVELAPGIDIREATKVLEKVGYEYEGELGIPERFSYKHGSAEVPFSAERKVWMHHHLYVLTYQSKELHRMLLFRDKLRNSEALRKEYTEIKRKALRSAEGVRQIYVDEKARIGDAFFKRVLQT